jgi:hypothetical protein
MNETEGDPTAGAGVAGDLPAVQERLRELRERKRQTLRWHMSRDTAERAIAAITLEAWRPAPGRGKSRRRRRHKRFL